MADLHTPEFALVLVTFLLIFIPRALARFDIPMGISALLMGVMMAFLTPQMANDEFLQLFATLGIVSLFLFAGLEVDFEDIIRGKIIIVQHLILQILLLSLTTYFFIEVFNFKIRSSLLIALALTTPSTGFILDSLAKWKLEDNINFWIKSKAIAAEIIALALMFFTIQSSSIGKLSISSVILVGLIVVIPYVFRGIARIILPHAPGSEFPMIMLIAIICAIITKKIGAYYLVGAFIVGIIAQQFSRLVPDFSSKDTMTAIRLFASFFIPFYFFQAGVGIDLSLIGYQSFLFGLGTILVVLPIRFALNTIHRKLAVKDTWKEASTISLGMLPTLVFTLVIITILREDPLVPSYVTTGLIFYTIVSTSIPGYLIKLLKDKTEPGPNQLELGLKKSEPPQSSDENSKH